MGIDECDENDIEDLARTIAKLQATADPQLMPVHDELMGRYLALLEFAKTNVEYLDNTNCAWLVSQHGPGWYFWDESGQGCGPYTSKEQATTGLARYAAHLDLT